MLDIIILLIGISGFSLAGYLDLKYTEFPDLIPYGMIALILITRVVFGFYLSDFTGLINSVLIGLVFLGIGLGMYFAKQWGDGDAWLLGVLGFLFPSGYFQASKLFVPSYLSALLNFFVISFFYLVIYSIILGITKPKVRSAFSKRIKRQSKAKFSLCAIFFSLYFILLGFLSLTGIALNSAYLIIIFPALIIFCILYLEYAKIIESDVFKRKIHVSKLRIGDVILSKRWRGLTQKEVSKLKSRGGYVWIKEGIRFAPVFLLTIIFTLFFGSILI